MKLHRSTSICIWLWTGDKQFVAEAQIFDRRPSTRCNELFLGSPIQEATLILRVPTEGQNISADYMSVGLTLRRHPVALLRERFQRRQIRSAQDLLTLETQTHVRIAGLRRASYASSPSPLCCCPQPGYGSTRCFRSANRRHREATAHSYAEERIGDTTGGKPCLRRILNVSVNEGREARFSSRARH